MVVYSIWLIVSYIADSGALGFSPRVISTLREQCSGDLVVCPAPSSPHLYTDQFPKLHCNMNSMPLHSAISSDRKISKTSLLAQSRHTARTLSPALTPVSPLLQHGISHSFDIEYCWEMVS